MRRRPRWGFVFCLRVRVKGRGEGGREQGANLVGTALYHHHRTKILRGAEEADAFFFAPNVRSVNRPRSIKIAVT